MTTCEACGGLNTKSCPQCGHTLDVYDGGEAMGYQAEMPYCDNCGFTAEYSCRCPNYHELQDGEE